MVRRIFKYIIVIVMLICCFGYITHSELIKPKKYKDKVHKRHGALKVVFGGKGI